MDRAEAVKILETQLDVTSVNTPSCIELHEALDLAIEALKESQTTHDQMDACYMAQKSAVEKLQLSPETSTNEGVAESATTTDCISRADTIKAMCQECKVFLGDGVNCADCTEIAIVKGMPPVNQKQVTGKLETAENATLDGDESTMNQPKSKLDCISRQQAIEEIALHDCTNGEVPYFTGKGVQEILNNLPPVVPDFETFCGVPIKEAIEVLEKHKHSPSVTPTVKVQQEDMLIIAAALWYFAQDSERNIPDRERAEELRKQVLAYGASMCKPVTPIERTGEWIDRGDYAVCSRCAGTSWQQINGVENIPFKSKYCPECGAKMVGEE